MRRRITDPSDVRTNMGYPADSSACTDSADSGDHLLSAKARFVRAMMLVPEMAAVEQIIRTAFRSDVQLMHEIPEYLLALGGKRIRPVLALLCGRALGIRRVAQPLLDVSAGIELIHMATLLHDDIIDHSPTRRHKPSPLAKYGVAPTLLSGDFLLTRAFGLCARLDQPIIAATERACIELVEGEALETLLCDEQHSLSSSLTIARKKTASLFRLATFCAAHIAGATADVVRSMTQFGEDLGIAFQIIDDILDVISDEMTLGKRPGLDIIERKPSVVNVLWLESGDSAAQRLLTVPTTDDKHRPDEEAFVARSLKALNSGSVVAQATKLALARAEAARYSLQEALSHSRDSDPVAAEALSAVIDFAVERVQ